MRNFQDTFETCKRLFIGDFSICVTVPSNIKIKPLFVNCMYWIISLDNYYKIVAEWSTRPFAEIVISKNSQTHSSYMKDTAGRSTVEVAYRI